MSVLGKYYKQPRENRDYDVLYTKFFSKRTDTISTVSVVADPGVTIGASATLGLVFKVFIGGGTDGQTYKVTVTMTSSTGVIKEDEFYVTVKEI